MQPKDLAKIKKYTVLKTNPGTKMPLRCGLQEEEIEALQSLKQRSGIPIAKFDEEDGEWYIHGEGTVLTPIYYIVHEPYNLRKMPYPKFSFSKLDLLIGKMVAWEVCTCVNFEDDSGGYIISSPVKVPLKYVDQIDPIRTLQLKKFMKNRKMIRKGTVIPNWKGKDD